MNNEYGNDIIKLTDDEGQEYSFEVLDAVETDDGRYVALMPVFDDPKEMLDDEGDLVIAEVEVDDNGDEYFSDIEDDDEYEIAADAFDEWMDEQDFDDMYGDE